jgi:hypothetical protein
MLGTNYHLKVRHVTRGGVGDPEYLSRIRIFFHPRIEISSDLMSKN